MSFVPARRRVFSASFADWLDNEVSSEWLADFLELIRKTPQLDWLLLTKRIGNWRSRLQEAWISANARGMQALCSWITDWLQDLPPENVWLGITVINQDEANRDVPKLLRVPAIVRFLSIEPMLGPVDLVKASAFWSDGASIINQAEARDSLGDDPTIDWIIVGGESGAAARPMNPEWVRGLRDQCAQAGAAFLMKQWGEWGDGDSIELTGKARHGWWEMDPSDGGAPVHEWPGPVVGGIEIQSLRPQVFRVGTKATGRHLDGRVHHQFPVPELRTALSGSLRG